MKCNQVIRKATVTLFLSMLCLFAYAQKTVTGTIVDNIGEPMIGVNVTVKGTTNGTVTDFDGKFTLSNVSSSETLICSYIGYITEEVKVGDRTNFKIVMKDDAQALDEVVIVGYGQMKKSDLTGSISSVSTGEITGKGTVDALGALQGAVAGVSITQTSSRAGGSFNVEIRGKATLSSNDQPLYVIDGVIADGIDFLNPQEIERIDILKDASSTAIYGSRATNGVVLVTTKSAKEQGGKASTPVISFEGYYGIRHKARMPDFMDGSDFAQFRHFRYSNALNADGSLAGYGAQNNWGMTDGNYTTAYLTAGGSYTGASYVKDIIANGQETKWPDLVLRTGNQQNYYVSASGSANGGDINYHFGLGYQDEKSIFLDDDMKRYNFKGSVDAKINQYLSAGISFNGANTINSTVNNNAFTQAFRLNQLCRAYDDQGNIITAPGTADYLGTGSAQFTSTWNPMLDFKNSDYNTRSWNALANFYLEVRPYKGVSIRSTFSPNYYNARIGQFDGSYTSARNGADNYAYVQNVTKFSWTWDNMVNYNINFGENAFNFMGLVSSSKFNQETYTQAAYGVQEHSKWYNLSQASSTTYTSASNYTEWSMLSYAARLNYTYGGKYMATATVRWDGSSRFQDGNRWGSFPSAAIAWRISEEHFMERFEGWLSNLKLRASYGKSGNNNIGNFATSVVAEGGNQYYGFADGTGNAVYYPSGIVNRKLSWEKTSEWNFGVDFGFLNNRISGSVDTYKKTSKDLLMQRQLAYEAGGITVTDNVGKVKNAGVELNLQTINVQTKNWTWITTFNFAHNKNTVLEVNGGKVDDIDNSFFVGKSINALYNYEWKGIVSDKNMTVPNHQIAVDKGFTPGEQVLSRDYYYSCYGWGEGMPIIRDLNGDGVIDQNDKRVLGKSNPTWTGSIGSSLSYKGWELSFNIYAKQNYKIYSPFLNQYTAYGDRGMQHINMDFYIPAGTLLSFDVDANGNRYNERYQENTHYGRYPFPTNENASNAGAGTIWSGSNAKSGATSMNSMATANKNGTPYQIEDASFWKVQNIMLSYTFNPNMLAKAKLRSLRLYVNITNPFVFTDFTGFDPEWGGSALSQGGPSAVTYQFGASVKF